MPTTVGDRVRRKRTDLGLTQDELAQKAGISKGFLSDLENGKRSIGAETLLDLGRAMKVSLDYLMTGNRSKDHEEPEPIPPSLAWFAAEEGLSVRDTLTLLQMQGQIAATRKGCWKASRTSGLAGVLLRREEVFVAPSRPRHDHPVPRSVFRT